MSSSSHTSSSNQARQSFTSAKLLSGQTRAKVIRSASPVHYNEAADPPPSYSVDPLPSHSLPPPSAGTQTRMAVHALRSFRPPPPSPPATSSRCPGFEPIYEANSHGGVNRSGSFDSDSDKARRKAARKARKEQKEALKASRTSPSIDVSNVGNLAHCEVRNSFNAEQRQYNQHAVGDNSPFADQAANPVMGVMPGMPPWFQMPYAMGFAPPNPLVPSTSHFSGAYAHQTKPRRRFSSSSDDRDSSSGSSSSEWEAQVKKARKAEGAQRRVRSRGEHTRRATLGSANYESSSADQWLAKEMQGGLNFAESIVKDVHNSIADLIIGPECKTPKTRKNAKASSSTRSVPARSYTAQTRADINPDSSYQYYNYPPPCPGSSWFQPLPLVLPTLPRGPVQPHTTYTTTTVTSDVGGTKVKKTKSKSGQWCPGYVETETILPGGRVKIASKSCKHASCNARAPPPSSSSASLLATTPHPTSCPGYVDREVLDAQGNAKWVSKLCKNERCAKTLRASSSANDAQARDAARKLRASRQPKVEDVEDDDE